MGLIRQISFIRAVFILCFFCFFSGSSFAQYKTVLFNYEKSNFNENEPLPAESHFMISGYITPTVEMVEIKIFNGGEGLKKEPLFKTLWKRAPESNVQSFTQPVNYPLYGNSDYDVMINYYSKASFESVDRWRSGLYEALNAYIDQSLVAGKRNMYFRKNSETVISELTSIVEANLESHKNRINISFKGFSPVVVNKIKELKKISLKRAEYNFLKDDESKAQAKSRMYQSYSDNLKKLIKNEIEQVIWDEEFVITDSKFINNYPTEKIRNVISLNVGYGGVYFRGPLSNLSYDRAAYAGISLPLGKKVFTGPFWSNSSVSAGIFLDDFKDENNVKVTGPIIGKPFYVGYGYKLFNFIRFNAGAAVLEKPVSPGNDKIFVRPFIGINAEFNLWMGLGDKKK